MKKFLQPRNSLALPAAGGRRGRRRERRRAWRHRRLIQETGVALQRCSGLGRWGVICLVGVYARVPQGVGLGHEARVFCQKPAVEGVALGLLLREVIFPVLADFLMISTRNIACVPHGSFSYDFNK